MNRNAKLFPFIDLEIIDFRIEKGQATPKHKSIISSKTLIENSHFFISNVGDENNNFYNFLPYFEKTVLNY